MNPTKGHSDIFRAIAQGIHEHLSQNNVVNLHSAWTLRPRCDHHSHDPDMMIKLVTQHWIITTTLMLTIDRIKITTDKNSQTNYVSSVQTTNYYYYDDPKLLELLEQHIHDHHDHYDQIKELRQ